jgi:CubicO group peptidase (beta-lactamase class C family)
VSRNRTALTIRSLCLVTALAALCASGAEAQINLRQVLEPYLATYGLPALAAAVVKDGKVVAAGAVGTRKVGTKIPVTTGDRFHLGSDTKAITALLAAILAEEGRLSWTSTVAEIFPELAPTMTAGLRAVTLQQLLSHTSGIPSDNAAFDDLLGKTALQEGNLDDLRYFMVQQWSAQPLSTEPGTAFAYSNMGYTLAGAMLERVGGKTWEELVTERIFKPLGLASAGFGPQATLGKVDAPLGHAVVDGKLKAFLAGPGADNPLVIGPAGTVHMSLLDFAKWAGWNAGEGRRGPRLVRPETLRTLHTPVISMPDRPDAAPGTPSRGKYALGWGQVIAEWAPEPFVYHGGSNLKNLAHILLQPKHDFGLVLVTNVSGAKADQAFLALAQQLSRAYGPPRK